MKTSNEKSVTGESEREIAGYQLGTMFHPVNPYFDIIRPLSQVEHYKENVKKGLPFFTGEELNEIEEGQNRNGLTFEQVNSREYNQSRGFRYEQVA